MDSTRSRPPRPSLGRPSASAPVLADFKNALHRHEPWVKQLWTQYRPLCPAPIDGWKQKHDDSYYLNAVEKQRKE